MTATNDPAADLARVRRSVNPEAYWHDRADEAEAGLAALRAGLAALVGSRNDGCLVDFVRAADVRALIDGSAE